MAIVLSLVDNVNSFLNKYEDHRTANLPLISSPFYTLGICLTYVFIVKVAGPKFMENRKPLDLKYTLIFYNFLQVLISAFVFYEISSVGWFNGRYSWRCQPVDYSNSPTALRGVRACYFYYLSKFTEFMDTMFFVLRKKNNHVSTLHVIHHGIMPMSVWFGVKFTPGGHGMFFGLLNSFVHIVMYTYYMLSAFGPEMQKYLWWKKYLTTFQMVQFVAIIVHAFQLLFIDCNYPRGFVWFIGMHGVLFFFLFKSFYEQSYGSKRKKDDGKDKMAAAGKRSSDQQQNGHTSGKVQLKANGFSKNGTIRKNVSDYLQNGTNGELHQKFR